MHSLSLHSGYKNIRNLIKFLYVNRNCNLREFVKKTSQLFEKPFISLVLINIFVGLIFIFIIINIIKKHIKSNVTDSFNKQYLRAIYIISIALEEQSNYKSLGENIRMIAKCAQIRM